MGAGDVWAWCPPIKLWLSGVIAPPGGSQHFQLPRSAISHYHPWPKEGMVNLSWILCCLHLHHPHMQGEAFHLGDESMCVFVCIEEECLAPNFYYVFHGGHRQQRTGFCSCCQGNFSISHKQWPCFQGLHSSQDISCLQPWEANGFICMCTHA